MAAVGRLAAFSLELLQEAGKVFEIRPCTESGEALHAELHRKGELLLYLVDRWYPGLSGAGAART